MAHVIAPSNKSLEASGGSMIDPCCVNYIITLLKLSRILKKCAQGKVVSPWEHNDKT
jgi:hypothetical protein